MRRIACGHKRENACPTGRSRRNRKSSGRLQGRNRRTPAKSPRLTTSPNTIDQEKTTLHDRVRRIVR
jgi:hypothetical protein